MTRDLQIPLRVLIRKDCSRVHYDVDGQTPGVELLVTSAKYVNSKVMRTIFVVTLTGTTEFTHRQRGKEILLLGFS